jgi:hypothetical protein
MKRAQQVRRQADRYQAQLSRCQARLTANGCPDEDAWRIKTPLVWMG